MRFVKTVSILTLIIFIALLGSGWAKEARTPRSVVEGFYKWYFKNQDHYRKKISERKNVFEPTLYKELEIGLKKTPKDGKWIDINPFTNAQWSARSMTITKEKIQGDKAILHLDIKLGRGKSALDVMLLKIEGKWKIANFIYRKDYDLLTFLREVNGPK